MATAADMAAMLLLTVRCAVALRRNLAYEA
jgi:hypothetical protein